MITNRSLTDLAMMLLTSNGIYCIMRSCRLDSVEILACIDYMDVSVDKGDVMSDEILISIDLAVNPLFNTIITNRYD